MFWPVMFEAASNVGPEGPLKKMPILVLEIPGHTASSTSMASNSTQHYLQNLLFKLFAHRGRDAGVQQEGAVCAAERS